MDDKQLIDKIIVNQKIMAGKPVVRGTRLTVDHILNLLVHGSSFDEILDEYPGLTYEDIQACLLFAKNTLENTDFMPLVQKSV